MTRRAIIVVIDALGVGAMPDAADYDDAPGANTLANIDANVPSLALPNLASLGLGSITPLKHIPPVPQPQKGFWGKMSELSKGKDTTTGHWEMMGICLDTPFPTYPNGFPPDVIDAFIAQSGCKGILGNVPASGTAIMDQLGAEHLETGFPIVYTSADSVFQIAAHVDKVPLATLYHWCEVARNLLQGEHQVSRVIARPFQGEVGAFSRLGGDRRDYAIPPTQFSCLDAIEQAGGKVLGVGKIEDIFCQVGITHAIHTKNNPHGIDVTLEAIQRKLDWEPLGIQNKPLSAYTNPAELIFVNLVETDMNYGHRRDVPGYANALETIDKGLGQWLEAMGPDDLLLITGDHGCDPTAPGSDHTREYVPLVMTSPSFSTGGSVGTRASFADLGKTVLDWLHISSPQAIVGESMLVAV